MGATGNVGPIVYGERSQGLPKAQGGAVWKGVAAETRSTIQPGADGLVWDAEMRINFATSRFDLVFDNVNEVPNHELVERIEWTGVPLTTDGTFRVFQEGYEAERRQGVAAGCPGTGVVCRLGLMQGAFYGPDHAEAGARSIASRTICLLKACLPSIASRGWGWQLPYRG